MTSRTSAALIAVSLLLASCSSVAEPVSGRVPGAELPSSSGVLVLLVDDSLDAFGEPVPFSGDALQAILRSNFIGRGWDVFSADTGSRVAGAERARQLGLDYFVEGEFLVWNEATIKFQGDPDRTEIALRLRRTSDGELVAYARGEKRGGTLSDVDRRTPRLLAPLVEELLEGMLDGAVLESVPADD
ncbi:MAG: hypothetical protein DHS20C15_17420 [Planctomycetota bacterium]|nr:MAG: hypothetical protein DHS20C15_17420 [Planctomycetota bacterium]